MDNTVFLKYAKRQTKHNESFYSGLKIKISHYWIAKVCIQNKYSEKQIEIQ